MNKEEKGGRKGKRKSGREGEKRGSDVARGGSRRDGRKWYKRDRRRNRCTKAQSTRPLIHQSHHCFIKTTKGDEG